MRSFAVVPAAGRSTRMGEPKLLMPWLQGRVIDAVLAAWTQSVDHVVIVVRGDDETLAAACAAHPVDIVRPSQPPPTMKESVLAAVDFIEMRYQPVDSDVWLLAPADQPRLSVDVVRRLLAEASQHPGQLCLPEFGGNRGHPVLFPWPVTERLAGIPADRGLNHLVDTLPVRRVEMDAPQILDDLDTPDDYRRLRGQPPG